MPVGESGRIVVEVDTDLKRDLYAALQRERLTLKEWFVKRANRYVANSAQLSLGFSGDHDVEEGR